MRVALLLLLASPALAGIIHTAPLEEVVSRSSHVALVKWLPEEKRFRVERLYRGAWPDAQIELHGVPQLVMSLYRACLDKEIATDWHGGGDSRARLLPHLVVFAEAVDGRLYLTGLRRYGTKFGAHASVRMLTDEGSVLRFFQVMNPGQPAPCRAEAATLEEFEKHLAGLLEKHPYQPQPGARPPLPLEHRERFFRAIGETFDWYQGRPHRDLEGWGVVRTDRAVLEATADRLEEWMDSVPKEHRIHGLDAMMILCRRVQGGGADTRAIQRRIYARLDGVDCAQAEAWVVRELRHGGYYINRVALGEAADRLGPGVWRMARTELEKSIERGGSNGSSSYRALVRLGDRERADAALKRRQAAEAEK